MTVTGKRRYRRMVNSLPRLAAVVLVAGLAAVVPATAGYAAGPPITLSAYLDGVTITPGMTADSPGRTGRLHLGYALAVPVRSYPQPPAPIDPVIQIDTSGLDGLATVDFPDYCRPARQPPGAR